MALAKGAWLCQENKGYALLVYRVDEVGDEQCLVRRIQLSDRGAPRRPEDVDWEAIPFDAAPLETMLTSAARKRVYEEEQPVDEESPPDARGAPAAAPVESSDSEDDPWAEASSRREDAPMTDSQTTDWGQSQDEDPLAQSQDESVESEESPRDEESVLASQQSSLLASQDASQESMLPSERAALEKVQRRQEAEDEDYAGDGGRRTTMERDDDEELDEGSDDDGDDVVDPPAKSDGGDEHNEQLNFSQAAVSQSPPEPGVAPPPCTYGPSQGPAGQSLLGAQIARLERFQRDICEADAAPAIRGVKTLHPKGVENVVYKRTFYDDPDWEQMLDQSRWNLDEVEPGRGVYPILRALGGRRDVMRPEDLAKVAHVNKKLLREGKFDIVTICGVPVEDRRKNFFERANLKEEYEKKGFEVLGRSAVIRFDDGEIIALVAMRTAKTRAASAGCGGSSVARLLNSLSRYWNDIAQKRGKWNLGEMWMVGIRLRQAHCKPCARKREREGGGMIDCYTAKKGACTDVALLTDLSAVAVGASTLEREYTPIMYEARVALSVAANLPTLFWGIARRLCGMSTLATSRGYAVPPHLDRSAPCAPETLWFPDQPGVAPPDWTFMIGCGRAGFLVPLNGGTFIVLQAHTTVHGTLKSTKQPDHEAGGFALVLKEDVLTHAAQRALGGAQPSKRVSALVDSTNVS
mmetsp:Transcript_23896/g.71695  ORF Transcript_23896/g.71695 Transcript_23896/m.71695 type:complete len:693 (+) Transcript_23896:114-2192(+)